MLLSVYSAAESSMQTAGTEAVQDFGGGVSKNRKTAGGQGNGALDNARIGWGKRVEYG